MITSLNLTNFMRHEALELSFSEGLQVVKGANESGKSSVLLGIAYAFFGAKALRDTFAETVTHGKAESSLRVGLNIAIAGRSFTVTRSKGGAEVVEAGKVFVTGQAEVTNFLSNLIGADAVAASKLMLASQGNLRGSLEQGPKATSEMIEALADFDIFERLIEAMQTRLVLGNTDVAASQVGTAAATLAALVPVAMPDLAVIDCALADLATQRDGAGVEQDRLFALDGAAGAALAALQTRSSNAANLQQQDTGMQSELDRLDKQYSTLRLAELCAYSAEDVAAKQGEITVAKDHAATAKAYAEFGALAYPDEFWEGTEDDFNAEWAAARTNLERVRNTISKHTSNIAVFKQSKVTASICGFCGKDFTSLPEIAEKNRKIDEDIDGDETLLSLAEQNRRDLRLELAGYEAVAKASKPIVAAALRLEKYITADTNFFPPRISWACGAPNAPDLVLLQADLASMSEMVKASAAAKAKAEVVIASIGDASAKITAIRTRLDEFVDCTPAALVAMEQAKVAAHQLWSDSYQVYATSSIAFNDLTNRRKNELEAAEASQKAISAAKATVAERRETLEAMTFNNALLRKVRSARPVVADKLWQMVLTSVSSMFSKMRGESTVVTKSKDGFYANGHAVQTLSGSTLDLLGLALRVALTRTFLPSAPFLILDEPFSAADSDRTSAMLAFIQTSGFTQVLLVTHEDLSGSIANNLVEL